MSTTQTSGRVLKEISFIVLAAILAGAIGVYVGYVAGQKSGRAALLAEQEAAAEEAQKALAEAANPFAETTPTVESGYQNPFEATNPFR